MSGRTVGYTDEQIELALSALAFFNGNYRETARQLHANGLPKISRETLKRWATDTELERYERVRRETLPKIRERAAERCYGIAEEAMDAQQAVLGRLRNEVENIEPRDLSNASRNLAVTTGVHTEKAQLLAGEPTQRLERSASEVLRALTARGVIDVEPVEETDMHMELPAVGGAPTK